jgi:hypothetical protein
MVLFIDKSDSVYINICFLFFVVTVLFRPQRVLFFKSGRFADGVYFCLFTRGYVRSSLTRGYYIFTLSGFLNLSLSGEREGGFLF